MIGPLFPVMLARLVDGSFPGLRRNSSVGCLRLSGRQTAGGRAAVCLPGYVLAGLLSCVILLASSANLCAEVMDVGPDGSLTLYKGPGVYRNSGFTPLLAMPDRSKHKPVLAAPDLTRDLLASAARHYKLDAALLNRLARTESSYDQGAISPKGAVGVMQLMDGTARGLGVNPHDLSQNIFGGAAYLRQMLDRYGGNQALALAAYNAGPAKVDQWGGVPAYRETQTYLNTILGGAEGPSTQGLLHFPVDQ